MGDTIDAGEASTSDWFFTENGQRKGPVTTAGLLELLRAEKISGDTPVWRKGLADWQALRTTDLGAHLQDTPPPSIFSSTTLKRFRSSIPRLCPKHPLYKSWNASMIFLSGVRFPRLNSTA